MPDLPYLLAVFGGFSLGGVMFSYHLPKLLKDVDVLTLSPDHNPGTVNAFRFAGIPVGILCLLCDLGKGFLPVFWSMRWLNPNSLWFALILVSPVLGHAIAPLYRFRGGKAIAASFGALLGLLPTSYLVFALAALYIFFSLVWVIDPHERRTVATFSLFSVLSALAALYTGRWPLSLGAVFISGVVVAKNIRDAKLPGNAKDPGETKKDAKSF